MDVHDDEAVQLKSKVNKEKLVTKKGKGKGKKKAGKKDDEQAVWDDIIDTLSDDKEFMQQTLKDSEDINALYGNENNE